MLTDARAGGAGSDARARRDRGAGQAGDDAAASPIAIAICPRPAGAFVTLKRERRAARLHRHIECRRPLAPRSRRVRRRSPAQRGSAVSAGHAGRARRTSTSRSRCSARSKRSIVDPAAIVVGRHGLVVERGCSAGCCCRRSRPSGAGTRGVPRRTPAARPACRPTPGGSGAKLWRFEAEVFGELKAARRSDVEVHLVERIDVDRASRLCLRLSASRAASAAPRTAGRSRGGGTARARGIPRRCARDDRRGCRTASSNRSCETPSVAIEADHAAELRRTSSR